MSNPTPKKMIVRCSTCGHPLASIDYYPSIQAIACSRCKSTTTAYIYGDSDPYSVWISTIGIDDKPPHSHGQSRTQELSQETCLAELRKILATRYDDGELRIFCFDLGIDYDSLPGEGKGVKAMEIVAHLQRRNQLGRLCEVGRKQRRDIVWPEILPAE